MCSVSLCYCFQFLASADLVGYYLKLKKDHPALISIEDGFDEKDYEGWQRMTEVFAKEHPGFMIVGDDLYTTNTELIQKGVANKSDKQQASRDPLRIRCRRNAAAARCSPLNG